MGERRSIWGRIGLETRAQRSWALYDWANSAFMTTVVAAVFPIYFKEVVAEGLEPAVAQGRFALATTVSLIFVAVLAPLLGRLGDLRAVRKPLLFAFTLLGALATGALFFAEGGDVVYALTAFGIANLAAGAAVVFYDSFLPHIAREDEVDRVSTAGFALGYLGGGLLLALHLFLIAQPERFGLAEGTLPVRIALLSVGVWWLVFLIPLLRHVPEPPPLVPTSAEEGAIGGFAALKNTLAEIRRFPEAFKMLVAFFIYNDGILTIIRMAAIYGATIGLASSDMIAALLLVQFIGLPAAFVFGWIAGRVGSKRAVLGALCVYVVVTALAYFMTSATEFYALAILVGCVQGGAQALSRSMFSSMIPRHKSAEFFGFFAVGEKFAGVLGPALFAGVALATSGGASPAGGELASEVSRSPMLAIVVFFLVGGYLLTRVDLKAGRRAAREAELTR